MSLTKKIVKNPLTTIFVNGIMTHDKDNCHFANVTCQHDMLADYLKTVIPSVAIRSTLDVTTCRIGDDNMPLYNRLKEYRAKISVNQQEMGALVGASRQTISLIERGDYSPSVTLALKIAKIFNVPVEDIFFYEEDSDNIGGNE